jgi:DNA-binding MarR family transcriptional regulator
MRWRRQAEAELRPLGLTLTQWMVLESTQQLIQETGDAVNQSAVAARVELDKMTTSQVMRTLESRGLVDRGPDMTGRAYRILVTSKGRQAVQLGQARVEAASARCSADLQRYRP